MSISGEKLYTEPGSKEEMELQQEQERVHRATGAKKSKGKTVAAVLLIAGALVVGTIFGTKAVHSIQETRRVDALLNNYSVENYVVLPERISSDRAYDITVADGAKIISGLEKRNIDYININGTFYTPDGIDIAILNYNVTYTTQVDAIKVTSEGQTMYMAPNGYVLYGTHAIKNNTEYRTVVAPASDDYNNIKFSGASDWKLVDEPQIVHTLPYSVINNSTLICDVPDNASLNDYNECFGTLDLAPKKR